MVSVKSPLLHEFTRIPENEDKKNLINQVWLKPIMKMSEWER